MIARIRTVKPELFQHGALHDLERSSGLPLRLAFIGIFALCDREGRFDWKPREMKLSILPYDEVDFGRVLDALATRAFIVRYAIGGREYGWVPRFLTHQQINNRETASTLPEPPLDLVIAVEEGTYVYAGDAWVTRGARVRRARGTRHGLAQGEGNRTEGNRTEPSSREESVAFSDAWTAYPSRPNNNRASASAAWSARVKAGESEEAMLRGTLAYAAFVTREGTEPRFVKQAATFFGPQRHYLNDFGAVEQPVQVYDPVTGEVTPAAARLLGIVA